jgi:RHS repeat-associated protein
MERGQKRYELSNHLGNVLAVVTDRKLVHCSNDELMWFEAQVVSVTDYYPFGMEIRERSWSVSAYRYGFNGKEKDSETFDGAIAFEARIYDSRIGRFFSTDPREAEYAWQSTYAYFSNCPIAIIDHLGMGGEDDKKVKKGEGPAAFAERNGTSLDELAASNPNVFENYPASDEAKKKEYWSNTSGKDWMIHEGQKLNVAVKQDANNFIGPRLEDGSTERHMEESAKSNLARFYQGVVQGGENLRKSIEYVINSTVDGDFGPLMSIIQFPGGMEMNTGEKVGINIPSSPEELGEAVFSYFPVLLTKGKMKYFKDFQTPNTKNLSVTMSSEKVARNIAMQKLGKNPVYVGDNKYRSADGVYQYRAKPVDVNQHHIHIEKLNPTTGEVLVNWHLNY